MKKKECIAMLLAGGEGRRLGILTKNLAKPAVHFGGKYRIIDFTLSNCTNSGIHTVGVLTQYQPHELNTYIGIGSPWDLDRKDGGVTVLSPYIRQKGGDWYSGTANAIYQNINFIEQYDPEYVLIISGDHIYKMDYDKLLLNHKKDIIPAMLEDKVRMMAYSFEGYWKDVGTIQSLWEANMDLLDEDNGLDLDDKRSRIYSVNPYQPAQYIASSAEVRDSLVNEGCSVFGKVDHSVLFYGVRVEENAYVQDSVLMPHVSVGRNVTIRKAIIGEHTVIEDGAEIGDGEEIVLIGSNETIRAVSHMKG